MIPVDMIDIRNNEHPNAEGDCFRACVASIFEKSIIDVPHFIQIDVQEKKSWTSVINQWLESMNLWYCEFEWKHFLLFLYLHQEFL